jgi:transcriptional regulator of aromatic amino acid metabolism
MDTGDRRLSAMIADVDNVANVLEMIAVHARTNAPVLLLGSRSTGVSFLAETLHACSERSHNSLVRARCGVYTGTLLEARLFGRSTARSEYVSPGAPRGNGMLGTAAGGSLFVEQIQNTTSSVQARLLDLVASQEYFDFERRCTYSADVRLIASAPLPHLEKYVNSGRFSPTLFSRLRLSSIELNGCCTSRERILAVIDLLRTEALPHADGAAAPVVEWWMNAARTATQTPASELLRQVVKTAEKECPESAPAETAFLAALREMSRNITEPRRSEMKDSPRGLAGKQEYLFHARQAASTAFRCPAPVG